MSITIFVWLLSGLWLGTAVQLSHTASIQSQQSSDARSSPTKTHHAHHSRHSHRRTHRLKEDTNDGEEGEQQSKDEAILLGVSLLQQEQYQQRHRSQRLEMGSTQGETTSLSAQMEYSPQLADPTLTMQPQYVNGDCCPNPPCAWSCANEAALHVPVLPISSPCCSVQPCGLQPACARGQNCGSGGCIHGQNRMDMQPYAPDSISPVTEANLAGQAIYPPIPPAYTPFSPYPHPVTSPYASPVTSPYSSPYSSPIVSPYSSRATFPNPPTVTSPYSSSVISPFPYPRPQPIPIPTVSNIPPVPTLFSSHLLSPRIVMEPLGALSHHQDQEEKRRRGEEVADKKEKEEQKQKQTEQTVLDNLLKKLKEEAMKEEVKENMEVARAHASARKNARKKRHATQSIKEEVKENMEVARGHVSAYPPSPPQPLPETLPKAPGNGVQGDVQGVQGQPAPGQETRPTSMVPGSAVRLSPSGTADSKTNEEAALDYIRKAAQLLSI